MGKGTDAVPFLHLLPFPGSRKFSEKECIPLAKSSGPRTKVTVKTSARMSKKGPLSPDALRKLDAWWRASNYLAAGQLYLKDNPLLMYFLLV